MEFDKKKYKVYTWKNWMILHWIINPGVAFGELILGVRVPKVSVEDITIDKPRLERIFVPCPHCDKLHDSRTWSRPNGTSFKNWFGLYCPNCGKIIPCLINLTTLTILALTSPLWIWFRKSIKSTWLNAQPARYENLVLETVPNLFGLGPKRWKKTGLLFGLYMYVIMTFVFPWLEGEEITWKDIIISIPVWTLNGLGCGYVMKLFVSKKGRVTS